MNRTVIVEIFRVTPHPLYKKLVKRSKKYKVDTQGFNEIKIGSKVRIVETKPISKDKYFKISKIISEGKDLLIESNEKEAENILEKTTKKKTAKTIIKTTKKEDKG